LLIHTVPAFSFSNILSPVPTHSELTAENATFSLRFGTGGFLGNEDASAAADGVSTPD